MIKVLLPLMIVVLFWGCTPHDPRYDDVDIANNKRLHSVNNTISVMGTNSFPKTPWKAWSDFRSDFFSLKRQIPNMMSEDVRITVRTVPAGEQGMSGLLIKDGLEKRLQEPPSEWEKKNLAERGIGYHKWYVDYIGGLKCSTNVEMGSLALGITNKKYGTYCAYYDTTGNRKEIDISYRYTYTHSGTKAYGNTQSTAVTPQTMQTQFKKDMKAIFDSLVIHDMDRERMAKEGLLHEKKYEIQEW